MRNSLVTHNNYLRYYKSDLLIQCAQSICVDRHRLSYKSKFSIMRNQNAKHLRTIFSLSTQHLAHTFLSGKLSVITLTLEVHVG